MIQELEQARDYIRSRITEWPGAAIVLGSAQAGFVQSLSETTAIPYREIPHWPVPTVQGHAGELIVGTVTDGSARARVAVLAGRVHLYEGWSPQQAVFGVRVCGLLGTKALILTNAAGGINAGYRRGLLVALTDHINLQGMNPLLGRNEAKLGPRFPDMSAAYDPELREACLATAAASDVPMSTGVYAGLLGPNFETPAEIRYLRAIGADLAGMSTVAETIAARHMGVRVLAISTVTNMASGMQASLSHEEVLETGVQAAAQLNLLLSRLLPTLKL